MTCHLHDLSQAYQILKRNVIRTLRTQRGADTQLSYQHRDIIPPVEYATVDRAITEMVASLNEARHQSSDPPTAPNLVVTSRSSTGGRPQFEIDPTVLAEALELRGPTHLADVFHVSARTIRRRAIDYDLWNLASLFIQILLSQMAPLRAPTPLQRLRSPPSPTTNSTLS
ncbi:hypothetical protein B0H14DRAFT_3510131 [Mycena olivaceomarginata]|nr:hypothetical protein B0H14DRAFT_3510131 [Mycena olivaceomarginata]